jgi:8-oxo-dGTP diphosphatase
MERKLVVAALLCDGDRILITQRRADQPLPLQWEFPGGKVEPGEHPEVALARELTEEVGVQVEVGRIWEALYHRYDQFELVMLVYRCRLRGPARPRCVEVADLVWCSPEELIDYAILPADAALVARLRREGLPAWQPGLLGGHDRSGAPED